MEELLQATTSNSNQPDWQIFSMNNTSGTSPFIDSFLQDPLELLKAEQYSTATQYDAPFKIVATAQPVASNNNRCTNVYLDSSYMDYSHITMLMPESLKVIVGDYTFARSSQLKIGVSARDGVDVFVGCGHNGGMVAAKQCVRRAPLSLPQFLGPVNKSNLVRLLEMSTVDQHSFVMITELCNCNLKTFITSEAYKEGGMSLKKRMCTEFLSGLNVLHANNIIHGNIKPENVLMGADGILKLGDYPVVSNWTDFMTQLPCTNPERLCWEATEVKKRLNNYSAHKSDIQVGGMLLHYIICDGLHPFGSLSSAISVDSNIRAGQYLVNSTDREVIHLLSWMLPAEVNVRKDTNICLTHPFFWNRKKQVRFLAAVGRQPEIRSGFTTSILKQINETRKWLNTTEGGNKEHNLLFGMEETSTDVQYASTMAQHLTKISDICDTCNESNKSVELVGDTEDFIAQRFSHCILPIYEIIIKSALCLRPQLEQVIHMTTKFPEML